MTVNNQYLTKKAHYSHSLAHSLRPIFGLTVANNTGITFSQALRDL